MSESAPPAPASLDDPRLRIDREVSLLEFFRRVLEEAQDPANALLERVKFLAIVSSNLAEFFMVRVAGLKQQIEAGVTEPSLAGMTPGEQLATVRGLAQSLMVETRACLRGLLPLLSQAGISLLDYGELDRREKAWLRKFFERTVFPVLTPLAVDPGRPFPHISNMSLNLAVVIKGPDGAERFARVKLPRTLPRLVALEGGGSSRFAWLDQVVAENLQLLFPGMQIVSSHPFRVTRDAEVLIQELEAEDLLETIERGLRRRKFGRVVRVTVDTAMPAAVRTILVENLEMEPEDMYTMDPPLGMSDLMQLYSLDRPDLKDTPFFPAVPAVLRGEGTDVFAAIRRQDILLHHPFDSFEPVVDFLRTAARDPAVLAIKQTLYRVGQNSPVVEALLEAAGRGKQVAVLVELKARFDEESNIEWARALEREGVHVVYGLLGLKTHSKIALVVRQEGEGIRRYVHLSTGNYNPATARVYTDLSLFTADEDIGWDASDIFNYLTGYSGKDNYRKLLVAPLTMRARLEQLILREVEHQRAGKGGRLIFKTNALVDGPLISLLYKASQAGVAIDLIVRGICCLRPGVPGVSETIRVRSIVGRFLEHSRAYYFQNGGTPEIYLGSADLMPRNLDRRVEVLFPVEDPAIVRRLREDILALYCDDVVKARDMGPDGVYVRTAAKPGSSPVDAQALLLQRRPGRE